MFVTYMYFTHLINCSRSSDVRLDIRLNQYMDKKDLRLAVSKITRMESGTRTGDAIHFVHTSMFQVRQKDFSTI